MWVVYLALAIALLALAILVVQLARSRAAARESGFSRDYVTIASVFVNIATLLVALIALYVAYQSLSQFRRPARTQAVQIEPRPLAQAIPQGAAPAAVPSSPSVSAAPAALPTPAAPRASAAPAAAAVPQSGGMPAAPQTAATPAAIEPSAKAATPPPAAVAQGGTAAVPRTGANVRVELAMSAEALGVILVNDSTSQPASEIECEGRLWDLDDPDIDSFSNPLITSCGISSLDPRGVLGPARLAEGPSVQPRVIEKGDRFFGYVTANCPGCVTPRAYAVYFVLGEKQGWYAPADPSDAAAATFTRKTAQAAAAQFLARTDRLRIFLVARL